MIEPMERLLPRDQTVEAVAGTAASSRSGCVLALPTGQIAGDLRPLGRAARTQARYELLVSNQTSLPLTAFAYALQPRGPRAPQAWNAIVVPPYSAIALPIEIPLPRRGSPALVAARLHAENAQLTFDASPPSERSRGGFGSWTLALGAVIALACVALPFAGHLQPHVLALTAPDSVVAGADFHVLYALADARDAVYDVRSAEGALVASGRLSLASGTFAVALPAAAVSHGFDVRLVAGGPFGTTSRTVHVVAEASVPIPVAPIAKLAPKPTAAPASPARIGGIAVRHDAVHGGQPIVVDYRTSAQTGSVRLIDEQGTVRAEALLNRRGRSIIVAPYVAVDQDLRVVVATERGNARDEASVAVRVLHASPPTHLAADASSPDDGTAGRDGASPIAVDSVADAGAPIVVQIVRHEAALHVALVDATGAELFGANVPPTAGSISLPTPSGDATAQVSVIASFSRGFGEESVIRTVTLQPKRH